MSKDHALSWFETTASAPLANHETLALIERCLAGDEVAHAALYNQHAGMVYRLAYSLLQHREDAEEVLQDAMAYAFRALPQYDARKAAFTTWLYRIAVSRCRNKRRRKWLPTFPLSQLPQQDVEDTKAPTPDDALALTDQQRRVWAALDQLSTKLRETAVLRYYHGLSYAEIGQILDIPAKTAESRMRLAHRALRDLLEDELP